MRSDPEFLLASIGRQTTHRRFFDLKGFKFEGLRTLRYADISIGNMYFLLAVKEKYSEFSNNFY